VRPVRALFHRAWHSPTLMTWASLGVRLAGLVVLLPVVLRRFATPEVAVWQLFTTIFTLILLLDLGLSPTFSRMFAYARGGARVEDMRDMRTTRGAAAAPDPADVRLQASRLLGALRWIYPRLALVVAALFALGGTLALRKPVAACADPVQMWISWCVVLVGGVVAMQGNAWAAALQGMDDVAAQRRVETGSGLGQVLTAIAVVSAGGGVLPLVLTYQGWAMANAWRNRALMKRRHPDIASARPARDPVVVRSLWPATWRSGVGVLMSQGLIQASGLVYGQLVPATALAAWLLALRVVTTVSQVSQAPFYSKLPRLAALHAAGDRAQEVALAQQGIRRAQWVLVAGLVLATFLATPLLQLIGSRTPFVDDRVWALMALAFFVERFGAMHMQLYSLTNHIVWHIANGATGLAMIAASLLLYPRIGEPALPAGMLIAYGAVYATYAARLSSRAFSFSLLRFEARAGLPPLVVLLVALAVRSALAN